MCIDDIYNINNNNTEKNTAVTEMKIIIKNSSDEPIYEQISEQIKNQIVSGKLIEGEALPSIRKLAKELQVSVITTKKAYEKLEKESFIDTVTGRGTFVAAQSRQLLKEKKMKIVEDKLNDAVEEAKNLGITLNELKTMMKLLYQED